MSNSVTKRRISSVVWIVATGPDYSHLLDVRLFNRMRDANEEFDRLQGRPRQLWRHWWRHPLANDGEKKLIREARP